MISGKTKRKIEAVGIKHGKRRNIRGKLQDEQGNKNGRSGISPVYGTKGSFYAYRRSGLYRTLCERGMAVPGEAGQGTAGGVGTQCGALAHMEGGRIA